MAATDSPNARQGSTTGLPCTMTDQPMTADGLPPPVMVPLSFLAALLHDSTCPWEPFALTCGDPLHGTSFGPLRDKFLRVVANAPSDGES